MIVLAAAACRPDCAPRAGQARTNVVLVTIDTLRADHLGCYGNRTVRTPELDRLAAEGALFERCYAQAHLTLPSHLTILTSLPPAEHGVLDNGWKLRRHVDALPGVFAQAGYRTGAFGAASGSARPRCAPSSGSSGSAAGGSAHSSSTRWISRATATRRTSAPACGSSAPSCCTVFR